MRGVVVSIQVVILLVVVLAVALAVAGFLYTTLYASMQYSYIAIVDAHVYPKGDGAEAKICFTTSGAGSVKIIYLEVGGVSVSDIRLYTASGQTDAVVAGSSGYVKAELSLDVRQVQVLEGRVMTDRGFMFLFAVRFVQSEAKCPWE